MKISTIAREILLLLIKGYKMTVSPFLPPLCRFQPTCSEYMRESLMKHGILKGLIMGCARIIRCNPFCEGGFDPVPEKFTLSGKKHENGEIKNSEI